MRREVLTYFSVSMMGGDSALDADAETGFSAEVGRRFDEDGAEASVADGEGSGGVRMLRWLPTSVRGERSFLLLVVEAADSEGEAELRVRSLDLLLDWFLPLFSSLAGDIIDCEVCPKEKDDRLRGPGGLGMSMMSLQLDVARLVLFVLFARDPLWCCIIRFRSCDGEMVRRRPRDDMLSYSCSSLPGKWPCERQNK